jgi:16S rRNA (uracil1498-N3)-methyltransferase
MDGLIDARTGGPTGRGGPHAFVPDLDQPVLADLDHHHLAKSLRLRVGSPLTISDGAGRWRAARFGEQPEPDGPVHAVPRPEHPITIGFTPVKGDRPEWTVRRLTELGVDTIWILQSERSVVRWDGERATKQIEKFEKVIREAAMQSRRIWLPAITAEGNAVAAMGRPGAVVADRGGRGLNLDDRVVLVGPEGGWSASELEAASDTVVIGEQVLRAETAALAAATLAVALRGGLLGS